MLDRFMTTAAVILTLGACAGEADGTAPTLNSLTYAPERILAGEATNVTGTVLFEDPEGDLLELHSEIVGPDGRPVLTAPSPIAGSEGLRAGQVNIALVVNMPASGTYTLRVWVRDAHGHDSNVLTGPLHVE